MNEAVSKSRGGFLFLEALFCQTVKNCKVVMWIDTIVFGDQ
jgi:hypothetical protein